MSRIATITMLLGAAIFESTQILFCLGKKLTLSRSRTGRELRPAQQDIPHLLPSLHHLQRIPLLPPPTRNVQLQPNRSLRFLRALDCALHRRHIRPARHIRRIHWAYALLPHHVLHTSGDVRAHSAPGLRHSRIRRHIVASQPHRVRRYGIQRQLAHPNLWARFTEAHKEFTGRWAALLLVSNIPEFPIKRFL